MGGSKRKASRQIARPRKARRTGGGRVGRSVSAVKVYKFERKGTLTTVQGSAVYTPYNLGAYSWTMNSVINPTDFSNLFEQFRLNWVKLTFHLKTDPSSQNGTVTAGWTPAYYPKLYYFTDHTDETPPSINECRERAGVKMKILKPDTLINVWVKPNLLQEVYKGVASTTYKPIYGTWLPDMAAKHYGLKWVIDDFRNPNYFLDVETTYYFDCKQAQ